MSYADDIRKHLPRFRKPAPEIDPRVAAEAQRRGQRAKQLLDDADLKRAFDTVEAVYLNAWRNSLATDVEVRERAHVAVSLLKDLRNYLLATVEQGDAMARKLEKVASNA